MVEILVGSIRAVLSRGPFRPYSSRLGYYVPNALRGSPTFVPSLSLSLSRLLPPEIEYFQRRFYTPPPPPSFPPRGKMLRYRLATETLCFESFDKPSSMIPVRLLLDFKRDELDESEKCE